MSERYSRIYKLPADHDQGDAPVIVAAGALLRDNETGTVLAQLKLQNIAYKIVTAVTVNVVPLDAGGSPLGDCIEYTYKNLAADEDDYFGDRVPVPFDDPNTRKFSVTVEEVVFYDNTFWPGMGFISDELPPIDDEGEDEAEETEADAEAVEAAGEAEETTEGSESDEEPAEASEPETDEELEAIAADEGAAEPEAGQPAAEEEPAGTEEAETKEWAEAEPQEKETEEPEAEDAEPGTDEEPEAEGAEPEADEELEAEAADEGAAEPEAEQSAAETAAEAAEKTESTVGETEGAPAKAAAAADYGLTAQDILELTSSPKDAPEPEKNEKKKKNNIIIYAILAVVIIAVVLIACGVQLGWFGSDDETVSETAAAETSAAEDETGTGESDAEAATGSEAEMTMEDYTTIEVAQSVVDTVDDDLVQDAVDTMLSTYASSETVTEGTVEEGDVIYISYVGTLDGEEFDGGSSDGTTITVGSSGYIDGFDDGLIGVEIGETVDLDLTFPDDYSSEDLAGQDVVFSVTVQYKTETYTPDLTDDFVTTYSYEYWGEQVDTVDDLYTYIYDYYYDYYLHSAMLSELQTKQTVISYDEETYTMLYEYAYEEVSYYASYYGMDADTLASYYGYDDADAYATDEATYYADLIILFDYIWEDIGLEAYTDEDVDNALEEYIERQGYSDYYTLEEFKEASGDTWLLIFEGVEFRYTTLMEALEDRVVFIEE